MDAKNFALTSSARPFNRVERLNRGGRLILYSGTPIIGSADPLFESLTAILQRGAGNFSYEEIDPDVFGDELDRQTYPSADRLAAIGLTATKGG